jgi:hypothetical protein
VTEEDVSESGEGGGTTRRASPAPRAPLGDDEGDVLGRDGDPELDEDLRADDPAEDLDDADLDGDPEQ